MPDDQSTVGFAFEADCWLCRKSDGIDRAGLGGAVLQHFMPPPENTESEPAVSRLHGATEPPDPLSWFASKPLPGSGMCCDPLVKRRHANAQIVSHLLTRQPTGQCDPHRVLAKFVRPFQPHSQSPLLQ